MGHNPPLRCSVQTGKGAPPTRGRARPRTNTRKCFPICCWRWTRRQAVDEARASTRFEIVRRLLPTVADHFIFDHLTFVERAQAGTFDRGDGDMDEYISAAVLGLNESIALRRVEPFHGASSQRSLPACTNLIAATRPSCDRSSEVSVASGKARRKVCSKRKSAANKAKLEHRDCTRFSQGVQQRELTDERSSLDNLTNKAHAR